jgi:hypothetical protein
MRKALFGLITIGVTILAARGDIIPTLNPGTPASTAGGFLWNYGVNVTVDQQVNPGDFFTIYDFGTFNPGSNLQPANWTFSSSNTGINPSLVNPTDNASLANLTWTYNGTTAITGAQLIGQFSVVAATNQLATGSFAAQGTRSGGPNVGTAIDNVGTVSVPVPEMSTLLPILSVCGAGVAASIPSLLRRRKKN